MTASSPYAPIRRQSSSGSALRRSSSIETAVNSGATATFFWIFIRFWRKAASENTGAASIIRALLDGLAETVSTNLTVSDEYQSNKNGGIRRRDLSTALRWVVAIIGGDQSRLGKVALVMIGFIREVLLRSIGAANVILTGAPTLTSLQMNEQNQRFANNVMTQGSPRVIDDEVVDALNEEGIIASKCIDIDVIRRDRQQIDQVLSYWFGQASPDGAQKTLWMIASSSVELLERVDADIADKFRALIWDLSSSSITSNGCENAEGLLFDKGKMQRWTQDVEVFGWQGKVAAIIALDQLSRHIHRHDKNAQSQSAQIPEQRLLDNIAYDISRELQKQHENELSTGIIPLPMRIFAIMPLRHAANVSDYSIVQNDIESSALLHDEMDRMIRRFRKATNRRMADLQDKARREGKLGVKEDDEDVDEKKQGCEVKENKEFEDDQILECSPFEADMSTANDHAIVKTIRNFLKNVNILETMDSKAFKSIAGTKDDKVPTAIVSLSGGVDSMVIAAALAFIRDEEASRRNVDPNDVLRIIAIHIDYANRPESSAEAGYVGRYAAQLGAKFVCRKIDEVNRGVTARDDYERISREIRFELYRQCCREAIAGTERSGIGVMLGHHRGDLRENVISNAHKGNGPLDLSGMTSVSTNDGVNLFRPLLPLEKTEVFDYAHKYGVPYFKDTTPHWSTRGKLRNRLLPLLQEIYGEGSMNNLSSLAEESDDARKLMEESVIQPFLEHVKHYPMGIAFETAQWKNLGLFFWKFVLRQVLHSIGRGMFSDKSTETFLERISQEKLKEGWLQCRKDYAVYLQKNGRVLIFQPNSFPFHKRDHYKKRTEPVLYGSENKITIGPWSCSAEIMNNITEKESTKLLKSKALRDLEDLMKGSVTYYIAAPITDGETLPSPLVHFEGGFTKPSRPTAWKGFDLKFEATLPLLGIDQSKLDNNPLSFADEDYGKTWTLVKVHLALG
jgi:tRNA(Ile)-lysidine synthetase-like protein